MYAGLGLGDSAQQMCNIIRRVHPLEKPLKSKDSSNKSFPITFSNSTVELKRAYFSREKRFDFHKQKKKTQ